MVKRTIYTTLFILLFGQLNDCWAQSSTYQRVDDYVRSLGSMSSSNMAIITDSITLPFSSKAEKARAIFVWIATQIEIDPKTTRNPDNKLNNAETVFRLRKGNPTGFSLLFQEMCSLASIRCISVDGYVKYSTDDINEPLDEPNHAWNVIQLSTSPTEWYYIDACSASGTLDKRVTLFTRQFNDVYFFADRTAFNLHHYPSNKAWQLGDGPGTLKEFYQLPCILPGAYRYRLSRPIQPGGYFISSTEKKATFSLAAYNSSNIGTVEIITGEGAKASKPIRMNYIIEGNRIEWQYTFAKSDSYPVTILFDGSEVVRFMAEIE